MKQNNDDDDGGDNNNNRYKHSVRYHSASILLHSVFALSRLRRSMTRWRCWIRCVHHIKCTYCLILCSMNHECTLYTFAASARCRAWVPEHIGSESSHHSLFRRNLISINMKFSDPAALCLEQRRLKPKIAAIEDTGRNTHANHSWMFSTSDNIGSQLAAAVKVSCLFVNRKTHICKNDKILFCIDFVTQLNSMIMAWERERLSFLIPANGTKVICNCSKVT